MNEISSNVETTDSDGMSGEEFFVVLDKVYQYQPTVDLDAFVNGIRYSNLKSKCKTMNEKFLLVPNSTYIRYITLYENMDGVTIQSCSTIREDFTADITVHKTKLSADHLIWNNLPSKFTSLKSIEKLLKAVSSLNVCIGNPEPHFSNMSTVYPPRPSENCKGYKEPDMGASFEGYSYSSTIRSRQCLLLTTGDRCINCQQYRRTLTKRYFRQQDKIPTPQKDWLSSTKGNKKLTETEKLAKLSQIKCLSKNLKAKVKSLELKVNKAISDNGVQLNDRDNNDFSGLMSGLGTQIEKEFPDSASYQRVFWEQQIKFNKLKDKRGMRWHPLMIKWCIYLKSKSSSTYDALKNSGFINLPSERLLYDYSHFIKAGVDFSPDLVEALRNEVKQKKLTEEWQQYVGILQDEIRIKEDLVYDKHSGELIGFVNLDKIGNAINHMEDCLKDQTPKLAKNVLVIMVRGIANNLRFPFAHFATTGITSDQLFPILWKAVELLEIDVGLKVLFITSDGASPNRRFIRLHNTNDQQGIVYKAENLFAEDERSIYFISDPPHLLKTARNCFANSYSHKKTRKLWKNGKDISWMHVVDLFKDHCSAGLRICPKLSRNHIDISSFGCMKVSYAAQVLSSTVAGALELLYGPEVSETVCFIRHMNKFFDCLNVRSLHEATATRNPNLDVYRTPDDPRLDYLLNEFLDYFKTWKTDVENRGGQFTKSQKASMQLSYQTLQGFEITIKSIVECVKIVLSKGAPFVLTEHFNQDPIEQHFGAIRSGGGCNNNPNLNEFNHAIGKVRVAGSQALAPVRGNTKRNLNFDFAEACQPLPKRKRNR